jgi:HAE1 family hydrophobic/amphiphilic exporter-1
VSIARTSTRRPVAVAMLFLAVILLGIISFMRLPIDLLPDVSYPQVVIFTSYPEVAPAEVERQITRTIENEASAVPGVQRVESVSREGISLVTVRFAWGTDMDFAVLDLRERMDDAAAAFQSSASTASRPRILRVDPEAEPIMALSVARGGDLWQTKELAETVFRRRLEQLDGVAQATVTGGLDREIQVDVDPRRLQTYGLTLEEVSQALDRANEATAMGGTIIRGRYRYPLRTLGAFESVAQIEEVVVARQGAAGSGTDPGSPSGAAPEGSGQQEAPREGVVHIRDIATVTDGFAERETIARYNGGEAVGILVFKDAGANTVAVAERVGEVLEQLREEYPTISLEVASSQAGFISDSITNVVQALVFGGLLAFLVLFLFLRDTRYPFAIAAAIPISVVGTFALMEAAGVSLNIMSLGGLALGVGMLVDNSIVVLENVFRHRENGVEPLEAAGRGADEVQGAITASTLTTISVFGPIIYVEGVAGELFGDLSLAVAFSLLASLLVALTLLPTLAARFGSEHQIEVPPRPPEPLPEPHQFVGRVRWVGAGIARFPIRAVKGSGRFGKELVLFWWSGIGGVLRRVFQPVLDAFDRGFASFAERYHATLEWSLDHRARVLAFAGLALAASVLLALTLPRDLLPDVDQGAFDVRLQLAEGTGIEGTVTSAVPIERGLLADEGVGAVFSRIGRDVRAYAEGEEESGLNTASFQVRLEPGHRVEDVVERVRTVGSGLSSDATVAFQTGGTTALGAVLGGGEADVSVRVRGEDLDLMQARAEEVRSRLAALDFLGNVRIGTEEGTPQIQVEVLRDAAARHGIQPSVVANTVDRAMRGDLATEFQDFDRKIPIMVRYPSELRYSLSTLEDLRIGNVPLRELVRIEEAIGPAEVHREEQGRVIPVYADVIRGGLDQAITAIEAELADYPATRELRMDVGGENEEMRRSFRDLAFAFGLALVLVYMILAAQFESFAHPFTILMAVPLALVGAVLALFVTFQGINTMSLIGVVILVGIVVNDAIVKVDFINQARAAGSGLREAILEAGRVRLRPIIMTTVTTVLGLTPMALGLGRGADLRAPLAIAVIGGLSVATLLTLIVVPVVYSVIEGMRLVVRGEAEG